MQSTDYLAYLLRLRRVDNAGHPRWVITLHEPGNDREHHFADLIALINFLNETMFDQKTMVDPKEDNR